MEQAVIETRYALDTLYLLVSGMLVLAMGVGFSLLQVGFAARKHVGLILRQNLAGYAAAYLAYLLVGYRLMYPDAPVHPLWPGIGVLIPPDHSVPEVLESQGVLNCSRMADFFFQAAFAVLVVAVAIGATLKAANLAACCLFALFLGGFIYPLQAYWKWGGGFLDDLGVFDFAGSGVVHLCAASAALAGMLLFGARASQDKAEEPGGQKEHLPWAALGGFLLWFGWFGFTAGAELRVSNIAEANAVARIFVNTHTAALAGAMAALFTACAGWRKADLLVLLNGLLAGLVAISAESLTPLPWQSLGVGAMGGALAVIFRRTFARLGLNDPLGVLSVHGIAGIWGLLAVGLTNPKAQFGIQLFGGAVIFAFAFSASFLVWLALKLLFRLRKGLLEDDRAGA